MQNVINCYKKRIFAVIVETVFAVVAVFNNPQKSLFATVASHVLEIWEFDDDSFQRISWIISISLSDRKHIEGK